MPSKTRRPPSSSLKPSSQEVVQRARRLRDGIAEGVLHVAGERIALGRRSHAAGRTRHRAWPPARSRPRRDSSPCTRTRRSRSAETASRRAPSAAAGSPSGGRGVFPAARRHRRRRVVQARAHGERRLGLVQRRRRIRQRVARARGVVEDDVLVRGAGDGRPARADGRRDRDLHRVEAGRAEIPPHRDDGVAQAHDEACAGMRGRGRVVGQVDVVEPAQPHLAAVVVVEEQPVVAVLQVDRLEDEDVRRVLDLAVAIRGASSMSVMTAFRGSAGSSSPKAVPRSFSYWPTVPKARPPNVGDCDRAESMTMLRDARLGGGRCQDVPAARASAIPRRDRFAWCFPWLRVRAP